MSLFAALTQKWHYSVENPGAGRLLYREGNREYTFPLYREEDTLVLVGVPSTQRIQFFFNWHTDTLEFSAAARERILPRIRKHLQATGVEVRIFERDGPDENFEFYPELFDHRSRVAELLEEAGCTWFRDYSSIDLLHAEYGLEICGIQNEPDVRVIASVLQRAFPHWHHQNICLHEPGREPGWTVALCMFPARLRNSEWPDED
jgi:hypothetical protein